MKLSISNIGWSVEQDETAYALMKKYGYDGLEIAPTRIFPKNPYGRLQEATQWRKDLRNSHGFIVSSMQSVWFGRQERLFGSVEERQILVEYTKKAIDFAEVIGCKNLVFGCPRNRCLLDGEDPFIGINFFREIGDYAVAHGTIIGMEANPPVYNTNYINDTVSALQLINMVNSKGFLLNLDVGTMIENNEDVLELVGNVHLINHVHISEPGLMPIEERKLHVDIKKILTEGKYDGFVSIEMGKVDEIDVLDRKMKYVRSVFQ